MTQPVRCTPRQAEVVELAAEGLTARAIGRRLGISWRTVASHLDAVYQRNDIRGRVDLTRAVLLWGTVVPRQVDVVEQPASVTR